MIILADNDIVLKLFALDLFDEGLALFECDRRQVRVLSSAEPYVRRKTALLESIYGSVAIKRAREFLETATETRVGALEESNLLRNTPGVGDGEAILIGATAKYSDFVFLTDDTRALISLHQSNACRGIVRRIRGRVYCLPQIVLGLIRLHGWDQMKARLLPNIPFDERLRKTFTDAERLTEQALLGRLRTCIDNLRSRTGHLLGPEK